MLVTTIICWWRLCSISSPTSFNVWHKCQALAFKICHQHLIIDTNYKNLQFLILFKCLENSSLQSLGSHVFDIKICVAVRVRWTPVSRRVHVHVHAMIFEILSAHYHVNATFSQKLHVTSMTVAWTWSPLSIYFVSMTTLIWLQRFFTFF